MAKKSKLEKPGMTHADLVSATARGQDYGEYMIWKEPVLGVKTGEEARPDVLKIRKSWTNYDVHAYECKVRQADLDQDVKALKFEKYFPWCHRLSFVLGPGLDDSVLSAHPVGIIRYTERGLNTRRAAPRLKTAGGQTQSFEFFHALNMNDNRYRGNDRVDRIRSAREWLEEIGHGENWKKTYRAKGEELKELIRKASSVSVDDIEARQRKRYAIALTKFLGIQYWSSFDLTTPEGMIQHICEHHAEKLGNAIRRDLDKLAAELAKPTVTGGDNDHY